MSEYRPTVEFMVCDEPWQDGNAPCGCCRVAVRTIERLQTKAVVRELSAVYRENERLREEQICLHFDADTKSVNVEKAREFARSILYACGEADAARARRRNQERPT